MSRRNITINKNDSVWYVGSALPMPKMGTVVRLTKMPMTLVGIQFTEPIPRGICCDGAGTSGCCLYATLSDVMTVEEYANRVSTALPPVQDLSSLEA